jgi:hypothetical protein
MKNIDKVLKFTTLDIEKYYNLAVDRSNGSNCSDPTNKEQNKQCEVDIPVIHKHCRHLADARKKTLESKQMLRSRKAHNVTVVTRIKFLLKIKHQSKEMPL